MADSSKLYAVLTGDLVKSSALSPAQSRQSIERLKESAVQFEKTYRGTVQGTLDSFRHDSWQLLLKNPMRAVRAAIFLRTSLKLQSDPEIKYETRIAIGIGPVETISKRRVSDSRGAAFTLSGKSLDAMKEERLAFAAGPEAIGACLAQGVIPLLDCLIDEWTPTEAQAIQGALLGWTQEESAASWAEKARLRPSRQAVAKALRRARWTTLERVLEWQEKAMQPLEVAK